MSRYRKVDVRIWTDEKFPNLAAEEKLLAVWLLTNSRLNRCGSFLWSAGLASEETAIPLNRIETVCDTVCDTLFWIRDRPSRTIFLSHWGGTTPLTIGRHSRATSPI